MIQTADTFSVPVLLDEGQDLTGVTRTGQPPLVQHVTDVGFHVVEDVPGVRDDQSGVPLRLLQPALGISGSRFPSPQEFVDGPADEPNVFQVDAGLGFVDQSQVRPLDEKLQQLGAFQLAAGKTVVHIAVQKGLQS